MDTVKKVFASHGLYVVFVVMVIAISIASPSFLHPLNIINVLRQVSVNGIIAIGMTCVVLTGGIDLSVGSILALAGVVASSFAQDSMPLVLAITIGVGVGIICGAINGLLIAKKNIAPFIVTLGMMTAARGVSLVYSEGRPIIGLSKSFNEIGGGYIVGIPIPVCLFLIIALLGYVLLTHTKFGRHVYAIGGNRVAAEVSGIRTENKLIWVYILAGALAGIAGIILASRVMSGSPVAGQGYELDAIAAVVIGGISLSGGVGKITGTLIGVLIIGIMNNGLDLLDVSSYWQQIIKGVIIVLAVLFDKKRA